MTPLARLIPRRVRWTPFQFPFGYSCYGSLFVLRVGTPVLGGAAAHTRVDTRVHTRGLRLHLSHSEHRPVAGLPLGLLDAQLLVAGHEPGERRARPLLPATAASAVPIGRIPRSAMIGPHGRGEGREEERGASGGLPSPRWTYHGGSRNSTYSSVSSANSSVSSANSSVSSANSSVSSANSSVSSANSSVSSTNNMSAAAAAAAAGESGPTQHRPLTTHNLRISSRKSSRNQRH